ncbi:acetolactate synthase small subunit [Vibrio sp. Vb2880]|uniref:Acetolactate synthase small subunit n=1 Tax=Vibrio furnissii TaxID=29494 RepID=A0A0Q2MAR7_VIBFU|nr:MULTISPECIES: acetolactate synthase small subunit [Vibrio]ADT86012.1 acetolactate synthase III small subunit [Vibrio furnissii NCTC 11218]EEX39084.1 acetolactate synthase small subunit [Vibrio furnissii CIP 102972]KQH84882.1 acetolactate synthase 3 regulatory subunit [Vibrio furnissii]MBO0215171.1 acetolactate synthase small subunit [Vibrio sp. Vb2880]MCG6214696.1 acetolactate synthase small subunit [Vibrio furnissii]
MRQHIISILLENQPGALSRVVGLFSQRGYNIESLNVSPTDDETLSRLNITTTSSDMQLEQIQKQLHKLIDVLKVQDVTEFDHIERELMLVKVKASGFARAEVKRTADIFRGQIVDVTASQYTVQIAGASEKLDAFIHAIAEVTDVIEVARSGVVGIARGERALRG